MSGAPLLAGRSAASLQHPAAMRRHADAIRALPDRRSLVRPAQLHELPDLLAEASDAIGAPLADLGVVQRVLAHDPDSIWAFESRGRLRGGVSFLHLSEAGVAALIAGTLDPRTPDLALLAGPEERPAGVYIWAVIGRGRAAAPLSHAFVRLRGPRYAAADLWALPFSADGHRFAASTGFEPLPERPDLYRLRRRTNPISHQSSE